MKRRWRYVALVVLILAAVAAWFEPTHVVRGWLRGEVFFEGRPVSFWRNEIANWELVRDEAQIDNFTSAKLRILKLHVGPMQFWYEPVPTFFASSTVEEWLRTEILRVEERDTWKLFMYSDGAEAVIDALKSDESPAIRELAEIISESREQRQRDAKAIELSREQ
jgi:hypothetical protein